MLDDPEPPPQPWRIKAMGVASVLVAVASSITAIVGTDDGGGPHAVVTQVVPTQPTPPCNPDKGRGLQALGAAPLDWASAHTAAYTPFYNLGRWDPDPRLPRYQRHEGAVYNRTITFADCAIESYYIQLARPEPASAALQRARRELPSDARLLWHRDLPRCAQYGFVSARMDSQLTERSKTFAATSALVRLIESRPGDKNSVMRIALSLHDARGPGKAGGCKL
jgi:hypothetical protein